MQTVPSDPAYERRRSRLLLDVLIRAGLILALVLLCYRVFSPFLVLMVWALILAVTLYPLHQALAARMGGRQGWAATLIILLGVALIVVPTAVLMNSLGDSVHRLIDDVQQNTLQVPPPKPGVAEWPVVGDEGARLSGNWRTTDLPALVKSLQPKIGDLAKAALAMVAGIGGGILAFVAAFIVAGIMMAFGEAGDRASRSIFARIVGSERGDEFTDLSTATIRAVAQGVIGVAFIQAIIVGLCLLVAGVPLAGVLAVVVLVLGIAQVPALIVTLPAIAYLWLSGGYGTGAAVALLGAAVRRRHGRQRAQAADARPRRRCADAGDPARRARRHGRGRHPRHVRRRHAAGARLPDLHGLGRGQPGGETADG